MAGAPRLLVWSPVPPQKTGTADYAALLLAALAARAAPDRVLVVCDRDAQREPPPARVAGFRVVDYRAPEAQATPADVSLLCQANNAFHAYQLPRLMRAAEGRTLTLLHDPQIFMLVATLCRAGRFGLSAEDMPELLRPQFGAVGEEIAQRWASRRLPEIVRFTALAQPGALRHSDHLLVHSHYAALKLRLETRQEWPLPAIHVVAPPVDTAIERSPGAAADRSRFTVGVFGWIAPAKRPRAVVQAFSTFLGSLPEDQREAVRLRFVGELSSPRYDPLAFARAAGIAGHVSVSGYLSAAAFRQEMAGVSLVLNLRYPSCGETSGTLLQAQDHGKPVAVSAYQAFFEESADWHVSIDPRHEQADVVQLLMQSHRAWLQGGASHPAQEGGWRRSLPRHHMVDLLHRLAPDCLSKP